MARGKSFRIGVISDTHGLLRPEVPQAIAGVDHILHLGDVGDPSILDTLGSIAAVTAIRGNVDTRGVCSALPVTEVVTLAGKDFYLLHDVKELDLDPAAAGFAAVLYGHSHKPEIRQVKGVLFFNPGSCGPRRFQLPISCGEILIHENGQLEAKILELPVQA